MKAKLVRVGITVMALVVTLFLLPTSPARAATITSTATGGSWSATATWVGGTVPGSGDDVHIASGATVMVDIAASANSLTFDVGNSNTTVSISGSNSLTVGGGGLTFNSPGLAGTTFLLDVGSGTLTVVGAISFNAGSSVRVNQLRIGSGTATINTLTFAGYTAGNQINFTGAGKLSTSDGLLSGDQVTITHFATSPGSTIEFTGGTAQSISAKGSPYQNLRINKSAGANNSLTQAITVNGNLAIDSGGLLDAGNQITGNATGTMTMAAGTLLRLGASSATTFPTNFAAANISLNSTSTVIYNAGVAQTVSGTPTYGNLQIGDGNNSTKTLNSNTTVAGNVTINSGSGNSLDAGSFTLKVAGNWTNNGAFTAGTSTVTFNGTATPSLLQTFSGNTTFNNLTINSGAIVETGTSLMTVGGSYTNNGQVRHSPTTAVTGCDTGSVSEKDATNNNTITLSNCAGGSSFTGATIKSAAGYGFPNVDIGSSLKYDTCPASSNLVYRYWGIAPNGSGAGRQATVDFIFRTTEQNGNTGNLNVYKCVSGAWQQVAGGLSQTDIGSGYQRVTASNLTLGSAYALGGSAPSAATLSSFTARADAPEPMPLIGLGALMVIGLGAGAWWTRRKFGGC